MRFTQRNKPMRLACALLAAAMLLPLGCTTASRMAGKLPGPLGQSARDDLLRDQVESDDFPSASQVGL